MGGLNVHSKVGGACCLLNFTDYFVCELFLQGPSPCAPLSYPSVFAEANQLLSGNDANVSHSVYRLVVMAAHAADLASHNQHSLIPILTVIREGSRIRPLFVSPRHDLIKVHLGKSISSFFAVWVSLPVYQKSVQHLFESHSCFLNELLHIFLRHIFRDVVTCPEPFTLSFHPFFDSLRKRFFH